MVQCFEVWSREDAKPASLSILLRETDLAGVAEYRCLSGQIDFADIFYIADGSGEFAGAASNVHGIGDDGEQGLRILHRSGSGDGGIESEGIARFGHPVMLDTKHQCAACARLGRAQQGPTDGAAQISRRRAHSGKLIDGAEV